MNTVLGITEDIDKGALIDDNNNHHYDSYRHGLDLNNHTNDDTSSIDKNNKSDRTNGNDNIDFSKTLTTISIIIVITTRLVL